MLGTVRSVADFTRTDVAHLLRRAGFFADRAEVDDLAAEATWADVVDRVLDTSASPPDTTPPAVVDPDAPFLDTIIAAISYWMDRMATTPTPIVEKTTFFWHGILTSSAPESPMAHVFEQVATWRRLGMGDIHELVQAMAIDPAMLDYLDNQSNVKSAPNENFARELMELFTMGNGTFTEADVVAMARAWTGHNLTYDTGRYVFRPAQHDTGLKTLFGITKNWDGPATITEILRGSKQGVSARYLAGRVWSSFAHPGASPGLLDALRDELIAVDLDMTAFLRVVFLRPEFRDPATRVALVRSPVEWEVAIMRATGLTLSQMKVAQVQQRLGQVLYRPPNVSGWRQNRAWISSSAQWAKGIIAANVQSALDAAGTFDDLAPMSTADAVDEVLARFGIDAPADATRQHLVDYLAGERAAGRGGPATATLAALVTLTPDFQLA